METQYSTGMRRLELANLKLYDLDTERGTATIRQGKGKKDRVIPIGDRAAAWIEKYVRESRPQLAVEPDVYEIEEAWSNNLTPRLRREVRKIIFDHFDLIVGEWNNTFGG